MADVYQRKNLSEELLDEMAQYCDEFPGTRCGCGRKIFQEWKENLWNCLADGEGFLLLMRAGIGSMKELEKVKKLGHGKLDFTIGVHWICLEGQFLIKIYSVCK